MRGFKESTLNEPNTISATALPAAGIAYTQWHLTLDFATSLDCFPLEVTTDYTWYAISSKRYQYKRDLTQIVPTVPSACRSAHQPNHPVYCVTNVPTYMSEMLTEKKKGGLQIDQTCSR